MTATGVVTEGSQHKEQSNTTSNVGNVTEEDGIESTYHLKWIQWNSGKIPIVMQSINGPCPLIATMNVLLLREKVKLPTMLEQITANQLLTYLGECIMDCVPSDLQNDENAVLNLEQNIHDAMEIMPKLKTGLDVNIRFTGITDFEYTPECIIFDLLRIPLYHGWLIDPELIELQNAIGSQSYNQLVDNIITNKTSNEPDIMTRVLIAEEFLERTASQLTIHGLHELNSKIKDNEIGILFRNNHFLTLFKREGEIYTLVTDHGYLTEDNIIWETLDNIEGAGRFFDSNFQVSEITNKQVSFFRQQQLENDFLMALSLKEEERALEQQSNQQEDETTCHKEIDDFELAKQLQAQEDRYYYDQMVKAEQVLADMVDESQPLNKGELVQHRPEKMKERARYMIRADSSSASAGSEVSSSTSSVKPAAPTSTDVKDRIHLTCAEIDEIQQDSATATTTTTTTTNIIDPEAIVVQRGDEDFSTSSQVPDPSNHTAFPPLDSHGSNQRPTSSSSSSSVNRPSSSRRLKNEKNPKESNCIVC